MKLIKNIIIASALLGSMAACSPEYNPDGRVDKSELFETDKKTFSYLNLCYSHLQQQRKGNWYGNDAFLSAFTDDAYDANSIDNSSSALYWRGVSTAYNFPVESGVNAGCWSEYFKGLNQCNTFLENIETAKVNQQEDRESWKAQCLILRALYSLELAKRYNEIPYTTKSYDADFDFGSAEFKNFSAIARQIFADCDAALECESLPWNSGSNEALRGMMTKAVAYAVKSQTALYAASPLYSDGSISWSEAADITKACLDALRDNGFTLFTRAGAANQNISAYDSYFIARPDGARVTDKETILETRDQMSVWVSSGLPSVTGSISAGACPSQELVDMYETIDGVQPILGYSDASHLQPIINPEATLYDEQNPYANRDPRLASTIYYHGGKRALDSATSIINTSEDGAESIDLTKQDKKHSPTGYYLRKYNNFASDLNNNADGYFRQFRFAEILLNYAEAAAEANANVPAEAYAAVNEVRARVNMPEIEGLSRDEFIKRVRNERRVEFAFEEQRYYDVRRWKVLDSNFSVITGMKVTEGSDGKARFERIVVDNTRNCHDSKYLLSPIPGNEVVRILSLSGVRHQNPGWE